MKKITDYKVILDDPDNIWEGFTRKVQEHMKKGWQPLGGVSVVPTPNHPPDSKSVCQVMVKYGDEE